MIDDRLTPAVILAGGSEIVALAVAEALIPYGVPLVVIGLGKDTLIRGTQPGMTCGRIAWPPEDVTSAVNELASLLENLGVDYQRPWPVFATEDGGLRLLHTGKNVLSRYLAISDGCSRLSMAGLDKAELFERLQTAGLEEYIAPTIVIDSPFQADQAVHELGCDAVFKPALKPFSMNMGKMRSKALVFRAGDSLACFRSELEQAWPISTRWVVQSFLSTPPEGEALWWGIRTIKGDMSGMTAHEKWKQPRVGGTACWVNCGNIAELHSIAEKMLCALDYRGVAELPFLKDTKGNWRLIEINTRPWLQVGVAALEGFPILHASYQDLAGVQVPFAMKQHIGSRSWVNIERMVLAALSGEYGSRLHALYKACRVINRSDYKAVYSSTLPHVRKRWIARMLRKLVHL